MTTSIRRAHLAALSNDQAVAQSLDAGAAGAAVLAIERAMNGSEPDWTGADRLIRQAAGTVDTGDHTGLFYGAPAVAFLLRLAAEQRPRYRSAADAVLAPVFRIVHRRVDQASTRFARGASPQFGEYDLFRGLVGLGALLLRTAPGDNALERVLSYLVELTRLRRDAGKRVPGWWVEHDPDRLLPTPGGHLNLGMAHGAAGILALLALAARSGVVIAGQHEAIDRLVRWYEAWRQDGPTGPWWPQWLTRTDLDTGSLRQPGPGRDSWCYGAVGIARALQLAAIATHDRTRQVEAERVLAACLTHERLAHLDYGLCHGVAGVYHTAVRAADDEASGTIGHQIPRLAALLTTATTKGLREPGLLTGRIGVDLARQQPARTGWDTCLLLT